MKIRSWCVVGLFLGFGCAAPSQEAFEQLRSERKAELQAFKDEIRAEISTIKSALDGIAAQQNRLETAQKELAEKAVAPRPQRPRGPDPEEIYAVSVDGSPSLGPADAWVTIVEISDFQCPFCARVQGTLEQVRDEYGKDVRIVYKHNPLSFHERALPAANAAECAGEQQQFWPMHDMLFQNQREMEDDNLDEYASKLDVNLNRWRKCYEARRHNQKILADQRHAVTLGARGTPAFFINGRFLSGAQPFQAFDALIQEELKKAKSSGLSRAAYYEAAVLKNGRKKM